MKKLLNAIPKQYFSLVSYGLAILIIWGLFVLYGLSWGLPNTTSLALDAAAIPRPHYSGLEMMKQNTYKYPPLQYLIFEQISEEKQLDLNLSLNEILSISTKRLIRFRLLTALMVLGSSFLIFFLGKLWMPAWAALLASVLYLSQGMSVYYAHTTNLDQPYVFWWLLSFFGLTLYVRELFSEPVKKTKMLNIIAGIFLFNVGLFLSVATKDQAYALYPLLIFYLVFLTRNKKLDPYHGWKIILNRWFICSLLIGMGLYLLIYYTAGGWSTFALHYNWISSSGVSEFRQFDSSFWGRITLIGSSLMDCYKSANAPLVIMFVIGIYAWVISLKKQSNSWLKAGLILLLLPGFSLIFFFLQITRFCYPRFWLPILPLACIISAFGFYFFITNSKYKKTYCLLYLLLIIYNSLGGIDTIYLLKHDTATLVKKTLNKTSGDKYLKKPLVGVFGSSFDYEYHINKKNKKHYKIMKFRNSSESMFGAIVPGQISLLLDPFPVLIIRPDILVDRSTSQERIARIKAMGYNVLQVTPPIKPRINQTGYLPNMGNFTIYVKDNSLFPILASNLTLVEQIMVISSFRKMAILNNKLLEKTGGNLKEFYEPDISDTNIHKSDLIMLARAYQLAGRKSSLEKALDFLNKN
jgi:4-amino-4-deoxy-L-arabinose transferase-like glycosyltransferase